MCQLIQSISPTPSPGLCETAASTSQVQRRLHGNEYGDGLLATILWRGIIANVHLALYWFETG